MIDDANEELLQRRFVANEPKQAALVKRNCGNVEKQIQTAHSEYDARQIADGACTRFDVACESSVIKNSLRQYIYSLVERYWNVTI